MNTNALNACGDLRRQTMTKPSVQTRLSSLSAWIVRALAVHRQRAELLKLTDLQLADLGLTRETARREASRAFWDFPAQ